MPHSLDQILPSLQSLGLWSYWLIGLSALLEGFFVTGILVPGTLIVEAGGILVQRGVLDFLDLAWFVAIGSFFGGEAGYWLGRLGSRFLKGRWQAQNWKYYDRAARLFHRHGGASLIAGRFFGPVSGLVALAAALSGMPHKRFVIWNAVASVPYALAQLALGYFLGGAMARLGPLATRLVLFALAVALVLGVMWYLVLRVERMLPTALSITKSLLRAIGEIPDMRVWIGRHPRMTRIVARRFDSRHFMGLSATLLGVVFVYVLFVWLGTMFDFLMADPIVQIDTRLASLIHTFWTPGLLRFFAHVTALGDWRVVMVIYLGVGGALLWRGQQRAALGVMAGLVLGMTAALIGDSLSVAGLKLIFARARPAQAYFLETSGSFPSGHAGLSVAFYGMLFYIGWRLGLFGPIRAALLAVTLAFAIGLSRLYLIEHFLSDVLNGYLVGALWLVAGIALAEWWREAHPAQSARQIRKRAVLGPVFLLSVAALGAGGMVATYNKARTILTPLNGIQRVSEANIPALFASGDLPRQLESLGGTPLAPISLIVIARDRAHFSAAMTKAGWIAAANPSLAALGGSVFAALRGDQAPPAPVTPYFWRGLPNDIAFAKFAHDKTLRRRHHARFWLSPYQTGDGAYIFVGTASFDNGFEWGFSHRIAPNIDAARDLLLGDLKRARVGVKDAVFQMLAPRLGGDVANGSWFGDGKAVIVRLD